MVSGCMNPGDAMRLARLAVAGLALLSADHAGAASGRSARAEAVQSREPGQPLIAVVSLRQQRIVVYDADGWILRAPVSSGQTGRETPSGIFSVLQKRAEHWSNLYDDAYMPHMQRITWSGIALHGGALPGYAASAHAQAITLRQQPHGRQTPQVAGDPVRGWTLENPPA